MEHSQIVNRVRVVHNHILPNSYESGAAPEVAGNSSKKNKKKKETTYDVIIIGGGVSGSAGAYELTKRGQKVLLLEQHEDGAGGSSRGDGRIIRYAYTEPVYVQMARISYPGWRALEKDAGEQLMQICGGADMYRKGNESFVINDMLETYRKHSIPHEILTPKQFEQRCPQFAVPEEYSLLFQPDYGVVFASKAVAAYWRLARQAGAVIHANTKVTDIRAGACPKDPKVVEVHTQSTGKAGGVTGRFRARNVIVSAGAWARPLVKHSLGLDLPLKVTNEVVVYFPPKPNAPVDHRAGKGMPAMIVYDDPHVYLLPQIDVPGVKLGVHHDGPVGDSSDPAAKGPVPPEALEKAKGFVQKFLPHLQTTPLDSLVCPYTNTPDFHFLIDRHPTFKNIILCSPCSGHGFKFGPAYGKILAALCLNEPSPVSLEEFSLTKDRSKKRECG